MADNVCSLPESEWTDGAPGPTDVSSLPDGRVLIAVIKQTVAHYLAKQKKDKIIGHII